MSNIIPENIQIDKLSIRENNPNQMSDEQLDSLEYSMQKFGYIQPIIVDQYNTIVDGAHRYKALKKRGVSHVDIVRVSLKDDSERRLLSQTMNKLRGSHDLKRDISEMEHLMGYNPDELQSLLGFDETGLDLMRQQLVEQDTQVLNTMEQQQQQQQEAEQPEKRDVEFKASLKHQCPSCGFLFK